MSTDVCGYVLLLVAGLKLSSYFCRVLLSLADDDDDHSKMLVIMSYYFVFMFSNQSLISTKSDVIFNFRVLTRDNAVARKVDLQVQF